MTTAKSYKDGTIQTQEISEVMVTENLVGYYTFDTEIAEDYSGENMTATTTNATEYIGSSEYQRAYSFNGTSQYITVPSKPYLAKNMTINFWVRLDENIDTSTRFDILSGQVSGGNGRILFFRSGENSLRFVYIGNSVEFTITIPISVGTWKMVTLQASDSTQSGTMKVYIDGSLEGTTSVTEPYTYENNEFTFMSDRGIQNYTYGLLDEVRFYNRLLTDTEIQILYDTEKDFFQGAFEAVLYPFIMTVETTSDNENFIIPTGDGIFDYTVDWGDGTVEEGLTSTATHTYASAGQYDIAITGQFPHMDQSFSGNTPQKIIDVKQWGNQEWSSMNSMFRRASNLEGFSAKDSPDLSNVTDMDWMFQYASSFNGDIGRWNTSNITTMHHLFEDASSFNQYIGRWDVSKVTDMQRLFTRAFVFNQNIGGWDTSSVITMYGMFSVARDFNQDIGNWNTSNVTSMGYMFNSADSFYQDISDWCVTNITSKPINFNYNAAFEGQTALQPQWGTCP